MSSGKADKYLTFISQKRRENSTFGFKPKQICLFKQLLPTKLLPMRTKNLLLVLLFGMLGITGKGIDSPKWLRYCAISPDGKMIAFTYKGDIYTVPSNGGIAKPITSHPAHDYMPVWSRDGKKIAFASNRHGNFDIFVVNANGGSPLRLTYHSADEYPYTFSSNNSRIFFGASRQDPAQSRMFPSSGLHELYSISVTGGRVELELGIPAEAVQVNTDGTLMLYHDKKGGENQWRKHHKSAITRDIWVFDIAKKKHTRITSFNGEDRNPLFGRNDSTVYYLSEQPNSFNVFRTSLNNPEKTEQLTRFTDHPVRFLSISRNQTLCFSYDGEIYTMKAGDSPKKVKISILSDEKQNRETTVNIGRNIREMAVSPDGKEIAFIARGEVFVASAQGGFTKRITFTPEQERFVEFMPDGKSLVYSSERNGKWQIFKATRVRSEEPYFFVSTLIKEEPLVSNDKDNYLPLPSPDGKSLAFIEDRTTLKVMNLKTGNTVTLLTSNELFYMSDGDQYFTWSPDSKWLLAQYSPVMSNGEIVLLAADGSKPMLNLTLSGYEDFEPKWVNSGKQMIWFSTRNGLRSYANSGRRQYDIYSMFFTRDAWDKYKLSKEEYELQKALEKEKVKKKKEDETDKKKKRNKKKEKKDSILKFDWNDLTDRYSRLTVHSASISDATLSKDGETLYYLARFESGYNLWSINVREKEPKLKIRMNVGYGSLKWDKEMKNLFMLASGRIYKIDLSKGRSKPVKINAEITVDTYAEREEMFNHVVLRTKKGFYTKTYHGVDWDKLTDHYRGYLPYIGNDFEFTEMLSEMLGELNSSHSGARYYNRSDNADQTASLGIFASYTYKGEGILIDEIIKNGPLDKAGIDIKPGAIILKIDGKPIPKAVDWAILLNRKAGKQTLLEIKNPGADKTELITVKPITLRAESNLLYKRWVRRNRDEVERLSGGKLGYIHIPGMSDGPYRNAYSEMMGRYFNCKGMIVDVRFNGGGDLVSDLAMFFTGKQFITYTTDKRPVGYEPTFRWTKPTIALVCEANYSDASCFACGYQQLGIGKLVGMPVPGTCSFAGWERLLNGRIVWGMVPVSSKDINGNWMENLETVPDIMVKNQPEIEPFGRDQQLEKAVEELLNQTVK